MFKTYIPLDWIGPVVYQDFNSVDEQEKQEIKDWIKDLAQGAKSIKFDEPTDKQVEKWEYKNFLGKRSEVINISYNIFN